MIISAENIRKDYIIGSSVIKALDGIDLKIRGGEFVAVSGGSGAGKSTLMNILGCVDAATSGRLFLGDTEISALGADELKKIRSEKIGFMDRGGLILGLSALENVEIALLYRNFTKKAREKAALRALKSVGLSSSALYKTGQLCETARRKCAAACAAADAELIFADEPCVGLDESAAAELAATLRNLSAEGRTVFMLTRGEKPRGAREIRLENGKICV